MVNRLNRQTNIEDYHTELKILLLRVGITQRELAQKLGVCPQYLNRVLRGKRAGYSLRNRLVHDYGFPVWVLNPDAAKKAV